MKPSTYISLLVIGSLTVLSYYLVDEDKVMQRIRNRKYPETALIVSHGIAAPVKTEKNRRTVKSSSDDFLVNQIILNPLLNPATSSLFFR